VTTEVDLANAALSHCGTRSKIQTLAEGSPEANACLTHYAGARDLLLRTYDWNFARLTVSLAQLTCSVQRWLYEYAMPVDCLRVRRLNDTPLPWPETLAEIAADKDSTGAIIPVVFTNLSPASLIYTAQVADPNRWDAGFTDALAYMLGSKVCFELTGKEERVRVLVQLADRALAQAGAAMANEGSGTALLALPEALLARGYNDGTPVFGSPR